MADYRLSLTFAGKNAERRISSLVHNPRLQNRLQAGSALALAVGWSLSVALLSDFLRPLESLVDSLFFHQELLAHTLPMLEQDRLTAVTMVLLTALLAGATLIHLAPLTAAGLGMLYFLVYLGYAFNKLDTGIRVQLLYPLLALLLTSLLTMIYRYFEQDRERNLTEALLRRHASTDQVNDFLRAFDRGASYLRLNRRPASILCVELRDSDMASTLSPEFAVKQLDDCASTVTAIVFDHHGLVVAYRGDSIVAAWNVPIDQPNHIRHAVATAIETRDAVAKMANQGKGSHIHLGLGISTGCVTAGRVGSGVLADYAVFGEPVGIAERLATRRDGTVFMDAATRLGLIESEYDMQLMNPLRLPRRLEACEVWGISPPMELERLNEAEAPEPFDT